MVVCFCFYFIHYSHQGKWLDINSLDVVDCVCHDLHCYDVCTSLWVEDKKCYE